MKKILIALWMLTAAFSAQGQDRYRQSTFTPGASYGIGSIAADNLHDIYVYNLWYSYWLNDTSTLDVGGNYLLSKYDMTIHQLGSPERTTHPGWDMYAFQAGMRYQPKWDFFLNFGFGAGLGYEFWNTSGEELKSKHGSSLIYYLLADVEYPIRPWLSIGVYAQPYYLPLKDHLQESITINPDGSKGREYATLNDSVIVVTGIWFTIRLY
jgi:hypothetical protein